MPPSFLFPILQKKKLFPQKAFLDPENNLNISSALCSANVTQSFRKPLSDAIATAMPLLLLLLLLWPEGKSCPTFTQAMIGSEVHTTTTFLRNRE